jgi:hypothetical protein
MGAHLAALQYQVSKKTKTNLPTYVSSLGAVVVTSEAALTDLQQQERLRANKEQEKISREHTRADAKQKKDNEHAMMSGEDLFHVSLLLLSRLILSCVDFGSHLACFIFAFNT